MEKFCGLLFFYLSPLVEALRIWTQIANRPISGGDTAGLVKGNNLAAGFGQKPLGFAHSKSFVFEFGPSFESKGVGESKGQWVLGGLCV